MRPNSPSSVWFQRTSEEFVDLVEQNKTLQRSDIKRNVDEFLAGKKNRANDKSNPFSINIYTLGYNSSKNLISLNSDKRKLKKVSKQL